MVRGGEEKRVSDGLMNISFALNHLCSFVCEGLAGPYFLVLVFAVVDGVQQVTCNRRCVVFAGNLIWPLPLEGNLQEGPACFLAHAQCGGRWRAVG